MGTNTLDVEVRPHRDGTRTSTLDANAQACLPIVDVMSGGGDHLPIPQINLSILGYEPNLLRKSHTRSPSMWAQEILITLQLDGPTSLPMRDPVGRRIQEDPRLAEQEYSYRGTYVQGTSKSRRCEYEGGGDDDYRRSYRDRRPPERGRYLNQGGRPPTKEDTLIEVLLEEDIPIEMEEPLIKEDTQEDPLMEIEDPLMVEDPQEMEDLLHLLVDKDHQVLKDQLDQ